MKKLIALAFLLFARFSAGSVTLLNECSNDDAFVVSNSISCTIATVHANSLLVVLGYQCQKGGGNFCTNNAYSTSQTATDTAGHIFNQRHHLVINTCCNNWTVGDVSYNDSQSAAFSGAVTFTVTFGGTQHSSLVVYEFSNIQTTGYFDIKNSVQTASVCSLPGTQLILSVSPSRAAPITVTWNINISCFADGGAVGMVDVYFSTIGSEFTIAWGAGGNFASLAPPFTQLDGGTSGRGYFEEVATSPFQPHSQVY